MESKKTGLTEEQVKESREKWGRNIITPPLSTPWWKLYLEKFKDPIIIILLIAAIISIGTGFVEGSFIEPIGIIIAISLATGVGFYMEYGAKKKFDILNKVSDTEPVKVRRGGKVVEVPKDELVVGDIVLLSAGDEVPADIEVLESSNLKVDESTMTGESVAVKKRAKEEGEEYKGSGFPEYLVLRSTNITEGNGEGIVVKVGDNTEIGKTTRQAMEETDVETPLQKQLNGLGNLISKAAIGISLLLLVILIAVWYLSGGYQGKDALHITTDFLQMFMLCVTMVCVIAPEGLPLANTLALAFSMKTMAKENNLVKKMHACETIGAINVICTDKTGTLTQNKMKVVHQSVKSLAKVVTNGSINSTANLGESGKAIGNPTEGAILGWINNNAITQLADEVMEPGTTGYQGIRDRVKVVEQVPFNSTNKYMMTKGSDGVTYVKGAPEVIAKMCGEEGFLEEVAEQQGRGRRAISFASGSDMDSLQYDGTLFIEDPVRDDVPEAVKKAYKAGVDVVMMTGDNIKTGAEIARQAGFKDVWAVEAKDWPGVGIDNWEDNIGGNERRFPNVIARCKPEDKLRILKELQAEKFVVAMTGDGGVYAPCYSDVACVSL